ncbi:MAG: hypothetical protein GEU75_17260 [Dehalococcoidia bacterium]|nr:hypothetical protein [Dehalococcoidia bacterium]
MYRTTAIFHVIPALYELARARGRPMTQLVAEAVQRYLAIEGLMPEEQRQEQDPQQLEAISRIAA